MQKALSLTPPRPPPPRPHRARGDSPGFQRMLTPILLCLWLPDPSYYIITPSFTVLLQIPNAFSVFTENII